VAEGQSGLLADDVQDLGAAIARVLTDTELRAQLGKGALAHAEGFRWDLSAAALLGALCDDAARRR
jgi:D-inositol-3-phosphate glycosyltransferase